MKTRHLELSKDIKFEEIGARKDLQTTLHHPRSYLKQLICHVPLPQLLGHVILFYFFVENQHVILFVI